MERLPVQSSALSSIGYDEREQTLEIEFRSGRVFQYSGVPSSVYDWLMRTPKKGGLFNRLIRDKYRELDVTPVVEQDLLEKLRESVNEPGDG